MVQDTWRGSSRSYNNERDRPGNSSLKRKASHTQQEPYKHRRTLPLPPPGVLPARPSFPTGSHYQTTRAISPQRNVPPKQTLQNAAPTTSTSLVPPASSTPFPSSTPPVPPHSYKSASLLSTLAQDSKRVVLLPSTPAPNPQKVISSSSTPAPPSAPAKGPNQSTSTPNPTPGPSSSTPNPFLTSLSVAESTIRLSEWLAIPGNKDDLASGFQRFPMLHAPLIKINFSALPPVLPAIEDAEIEHVSVTHRCCYEFQQIEGERHLLAEVTCYKRLEFLGDSKLSLAVSSLMFRRYPELNSGGMTYIKNFLVSNNTLAYLARHYGLPLQLKMPLLRLQNRLNYTTTVMSDAFEARIGELYLEGEKCPEKMLILNKFLDQLFSEEVFPQLRQCVYWRRKLVEGHHTEVLQPRMKKVDGVKIKVFEGEVEDQGFFCPPVIDGETDKKGVGE